MPTATPDPTPPASRTLPAPWFLLLPVVGALGLLAERTVRDARAQQIAQRATKDVRDFEFDRALGLLRDATARQPSDARLQLQRATLARTLWYYRDTAALKAEADAAFDRAATVSPHWPLPHYEHARMYVTKERWTDALRALEPALRLDPNNGGYWLERAQILEALTRRDEARRAYTRCVELIDDRTCRDGLRRLGSSS
ncbi:hypothetical protein [Deinococcus pimensis]|uniref:hypothetical protein n=1 Tax=Deinococcus pimensis TaxID=309888 RepID=UPI0004B7BCF3|nr:hypothetical protein [Deinococcus pimensis]